jgi:hemin uptake protein HemP
MIDMQLRTIIIYSMSNITQPKPAQVPKSFVSTVPVLSSRELLRDRGELRIEHGGELYCLRVTRNGKLILTK